MDNRAEVRDFLTSRRARITPERAGLPLYGTNRRVTGLRREEVALLAGVSTDYYTRLERGNLTGVSESVLEALASALQLDEAERTHLFDLARAANHGTRQRRNGPKQHVREGVQRILETIGAPAYVRNNRLDLLAVNRPGRALLADLYPAEGGGDRSSSPSRPLARTWRGTCSSTTAHATSTSSGHPSPRTPWPRYASRPAATPTTAA